MSSSPAVVRSQSSPPVKAFQNRLPLGDSDPVLAAIETLSAVGSVESRGAVFTRREVVDFLLDLIGYTPEKALPNLSLLEPSFGRGDFLIPIVERLLTAWGNLEDNSDPVKTLAGCIRAVELHKPTFVETKLKVLEALARHGLKSTQAEQVADAWLINGDFLLAELPNSFNLVAGNPPYVRQELIPDVLLSEYRSRYETMFDRADLYVPFIERSLKLLSKGGALGFICADRWMKNRYGGPLRKLVSDRYHLSVYVDMVNTPAFDTDVIAYPAITVIKNDRGTTTRIARQPSIDAKTFHLLSCALLSRETSSEDPKVHSVDGVVSGSEPWVLDSSDQLAIVRRLEVAFPLLEETGCKVGIGVATGADKAFIGDYDELDVEDGRKLPLVMTKDIQGGTVQWRGLGVVNPFAEEGGLVDLGDYPRLKAYLEARKDQIVGRHCARKVPSNWYRTIDRITPAIAMKHKLLIPDIKGQAHIVYEDGQLYPHHNLYYVTSDNWDLRALQAVLLSSVTRLFIATYSTKMHGGFLRFQAQYLRRLRLPLWGTVSTKIQADLIQAAMTRDLAACNSATFALYKFNKEERAVLGGNGE